MEKKEVRVTEHAKLRIKERMGLPKKSIIRIAQKALDEGSLIANVSGRLRSWASDYCNNHINNTLDDYRVWADKLFIFDDNVLITVLQIPTAIR